MKLYQTEQECGNGQNSWKSAVYSWNLMKHYLSNGIGIYDYWNISLEKGGISHWGWAQNSLVVVDPATKTYAYTFEYYVMKHHSHYILPGAKRLQTSGYEDMLAFRNPDGSIVLVAANFNDEDKPVTIRCDQRLIQPVLPANSFNTFYIN
jgi:glucosylceramidase